MFHYSYYWKTWSRILKIEDFNICELNITPVNGFHDWTLDKVQLEVIRIHGTARDEKDKECETLPDDVLNELKKHLDPDLIQRLLTHDYLAEIGLTLKEMNRLNLSNGGGVPLQAYLTRKFHYWK